MQLMPQTALRMDVRDMYDPDDNVGEGPSTYANCLTGSMEIYRSPWQPTMPERTRSNGIKRFPFDETRQYVRKVLRYYRTFLVRDGVIMERPVSRYAPAETTATPEISEISSR